MGLLDIDEHIENDVILLKGLFNEKTFKETLTQLYDIYNNDPLPISSLLNRNEYHMAIYSDMMEICIYGPNQIISIGYVLPVFNPKIFHINIYPYSISSFELKNNIYPRIVLVNTIDENTYKNILKFANDSII